MGRTKELFRVDEIAYQKALRREVHAIMLQQKNLLKQRAIKNLEAIKFHKRTIILEKGTTSDFLRKRALINSIVSEQLKWEFNGSKLSIKTSAMGSDFRNSFIGWYYEFGTGTKYTPPDTGFRLPHPGDANPYRQFGSGTTIVSRSKDDNNGIWTDMGGNKRRTISRKGGKPLPAFNTPAYKWFEKAHNETVDILVKELKEVPKRVNITHFIEGRHLKLG